MRSPPAVRTSPLYARHCGSTTTTSDSQGRCFSSQAEIGRATLLRSRAATCDRSSCYGSAAASPSGECVAQSEKGNSPAAAVMPLQNWRNRWIADVSDATSGGESRSKAPPVPDVDHLDITRSNNVLSGYSPGRRLMKSEIHCAIRRFPLGGHTSASLPGTTSSWAAPQIHGGLLAGLPDSQRTNRF